MKKATDAMLADHKMIRKLLGDLTLDNPRFSEIARTLERVVLTHAWFEDVIFLPVFKNRPLMVKEYLDEMYEEHKHIDHFMKLIRRTDLAQTREMEAYYRQFRAILDNHLKKEEDALFPLAERILDADDMNKLSAEMERRQKEAQLLFNPSV